MHQLDSHVERLNALLADRLGARRGPLTQRIARAGRRLPRSVRRDLEAVAQAAQLASHPKLAPRIDAAQIDAAAARAEAHLRSIDAKDRRKGQILGMLGALVFNLLLLAAIVLAVLRWRGFV